MTVETLVWNGTSLPSRYRIGTSSDECALARGTLFGILMRRHNLRVYSAVRAVRQDEAEVEDMMQQACIKVFTHVHKFEGHDYQFCGRPWIQMLVHNRSRIVLRCMRCRGWFSIPPTHQVRSQWTNRFRTSSHSENVALSAGSASL